MLISWNRLLSGRLRDPLVGRDLLIGTAVGSIISISIPHVVFLLDKARGRPVPAPQMFHLTALGGTSSAIAEIIGEFTPAIAIGFMIAFLLLTFRLVLKKEWLALGAASLLFAVMSILTNSGSMNVVVAPLVWITIFVMLVKFGLLATTVTIFVSNTFEIATITPGSVTSWTGGPVGMTIVVILLMAGWGFYHSLAGRPLLTTEE